MVCRPGGHREPLLVLKCVDSQHRSRRLFFTPSCPPQGMGIDSHVRLLHCTATGLRAEASQSRFELPLCWSAAGLKRKGGEAR